MLQYSIIPNGHIFWNIQYKLQVQKYCSDSKFSLFQDCRSAIYTMSIVSWIMIDKSLEVVAMFSLQSNAAKVSYDNK